MRLILKILAAPPGDRPDPVRLDLYRPFVLHRHGPGAGRFGGGPFRGGCACDLLPAKRHHPAGDCLSYQPDGDARLRRPGCWGRSRAYGMQFRTAFTGERAARIWYNKTWKGGGGMGASNKVCPVCGRKMKQQFIGLQHCKCGMSWKKDIGFFERTSDMVFALERRTEGKR